MALSSLENTFMNRVYDRVRSSPWIQSKKEEILTSPPVMSQFHIKHQDLYWRHQLVIPPDDVELIRSILFEFHSSILGGHAGFLRTFHRIAAVFFWPNMRRDIRLFIRQCSICQQAKVTQLHPAGLLNPLPIPERIWEDIAMDFITGLPIVRGYSVIFVVVDRLSKYAHFMPLAAGFSSQNVAATFVQHVVRLHGLPRTIVSDRDRVFTNAFRRHLMKLQGRQLCLSSAYHPQTDGQSKALNRCLEMYLRCYVYEYPWQWLTYLQWAEFWYNSSFHSSIGMTPFKVVYGRNPPPLLCHSSQADTLFDVHTQLEQKDEVFRALKDNLRKAQVRMKRFADHKRSDIEFQVNDWVLVKLQPYQQHSMQLRKFQKLALLYFGPFQIIEQLAKWLTAFSFLLMLESI